jgi:hypothetical protein
MDVYGKEIDMETATKEAKKLLSIAQEDDCIRVCDFIKPYWSNETSYIDDEGLYVDCIEGLKSDIEKGTLIKTLFLGRYLNGIFVDMFVDENGIDENFLECEDDSNKSNFKCSVCTEYNNCPIQQYNNIND